MAYKVRVLIRDSLMTGIDTGFDHSNHLVIT